MSRTVLPPHSNGYLWNGATWVAAPGDATHGAMVEGAVAAGAADAGNPVKVGGRFNTTSPTLTDGQRGDLTLTARNSLRTSIIDGGGIAAAAVATPDDVGTNVATLQTLARLQAWDGAQWLRPRGDVANGLDVDVTRVTGTVTTDPSDRIARLLGIVDGRAAIDAVLVGNPHMVAGRASGVAPGSVSADGDVQANWVDRKGAQMTRESWSQSATAVSAANAIVTLTIAAAGAGLFHYITAIEIVCACTAAIAGGALLTYTTTNIPTGLAWTSGNALAVGAEKVVTRMTFNSPLKTTTANTATTIVAPAIGATGVCRINVYYYIAE